MLTYCFESSHVARTLAKCKRNDLAVIDTEGHEIVLERDMKTAFNAISELKRKVNHED